METRFTGATAPGALLTAFRIAGVQAADAKRHLPRIVLASIVCILLAGYLALALRTLYNELSHQAAYTGWSFGQTDFFVPWFGARTLVEGGNPYTVTFSDQLHTLVYGRPMQPTSEFHNLAAFSYPPYVVLPLAPLLWLPFDLVRPLSVLLIASCVAGASVLWFRLAGGSRTFLAQLIVGFLSLAFYPSVVLVWLQQLSGVVLLYLAGAHVAVAHRKYALAGGLLALALIKPQVAALSAGSLLFWSLWRRERWPLLVSFALAVGAQLALSEWLLPGWLWHFQAALARYRQFNEIFWLPGMLAQGSLGIGVAVTGGLLVLLLWQWWRVRLEPATSISFIRVAALAIAVTIAVIPEVGLYNRAFLLLPLVSLMLAGPGETRWRRVTARFVACLICAPVLVTGAVAWLHRLVPEAEPYRIPLDMVDLINIGLPIFILPALVAACLERLPQRLQEVSHVHN